MDLNQKFARVRLRTSDPCGPVVFRTSLKAFHRVQLWAHSFSWHPVEETHFSWLTSCCHSLGHDSQLATVGEGGNVDELVNWDFPSSPLRASLVCSCLWSNFWTVRGTFPQCSSTTTWLDCLGTTAPFSITNEHFLVGGVVIARRRESPLTLFYTRQTNNGGAGGLAARPSLFVTQRKPVLCLTVFLMNGFISRKLCWVVETGWK